MPSLSAAASSPANLLSQLAAWLPTVSGWTLVDAISATDQVFLFSDGDTKVPVYCRITSSLMGDTPGIFPETAFDNLTFRLYRSWNPATHTGYGEVGRKGRVHLRPPASKYDKADVLWSSALNYQTDLLPHTQAQLDGLIYGGNPPVVYNGRSWYGRSSTTLLGYDHAYRSQYAVGSTTNVFHALIHTVDRQTGKEYLWATRASTVGACWFKYDVLENTWTAMADPSWGAYWDSYGHMFAWDGNDYIYVAKSNATASAWARYSISANAWTNLAAMPTTGAFVTNTEHCSQILKFLYIPAAVSGFAEDYIYGFDKSITTAVWLRYGVTSNTWETTATNPTALPAFPAGANCTYSRISYYDPSLGAHGSIVFIHPGAQNQWPSYVHVFDLATQTWGSAANPPNWRAWTTVWVDNGNPTVTPQYDQAGSLRLPAGSFYFTAVADAGHIKIVATWVPLDGTKSLTSFAYAGFYDSYLKTDRFTTAAPLAPGTDVTVQVSESVTGKLVAGDCVEIFDPTADVQPQWRSQALKRGGGETLRVTEILSANSFKVAAVTLAYPSGCYVGQDIAGAVIGNEGMVFLALCSPKGYQADGMADWYVAYPPLQPHPSNSTWITSRMDYRRAAVLSPFMLTQYSSTVATCGNVGALRGVSTAHPRASVGVDEVLPDGNYVVFSPYLRDRGLDTRLMQMGPL